MEGKQEAGPADYLPWSDLKVAFDCVDPEALWAAYDTNTLTLPNGWSLNEVDCSGARCVAVFRVEDRLPTTEDGSAVLAAIAKSEGR